MKNCCFFFFCHFNWRLPVRSWAFLMFKCHLMFDLERDLIKHWAAVKRRRNAATCFLYEIFSWNSAVALSPKPGFLISLTPPQRLFLNLRFTKYRHYTEGREKQTKTTCDYDVCHFFQFIHQSQNPQLTEAYWCVFLSIWWLRLWSSCSWMNRKLSSGWKWCDISQLAVNYINDR